MTDYARTSADLLRRRRPASAQLVVLSRVGSTQDLARRIVERHRSEGRLPPEVDLVAWEQTAGRGRGGREWQSPAGAGIWATALRTVERRTLQTLPVRVATALAEALGSRVGDRLRIKWPNDLVVEGKKLGGVLVDAWPGSDGDGAAPAAIGFGVNVSSAPLETATSLAELGVDPAAAPELTLELLDAVARSLRLDDAPVGRFEHLLVHRVGQSLRCRLAPDADPVEGRFEGLDPVGNLRLEVDGRSRVVSAAELLEDAG